MSDNKFNVKLLSEFAKVPSRANPTDAGLDLSSVEDVELGPGEWRVIKTGIAIEIEKGQAGLVLPRSGLAAKHGITIMNAPGLIDSDYRGEVGVILTNLGQKRFSVENGMRIAQLLIIDFSDVEANIVSDLANTNRGAGGFGSTGK